MMDDLFRDGATKHISLEKISDEVEAAVFLLPWLRSIDISLNDCPGTPGPWWNYVDRENKEASTLAALHRVSHLDSTLRHCIAGAKLLKSGALKRRTLAALYLAKETLKAPFLLHDAQLSFLGSGPEKLPPHINTPDVPEAYWRRTAEVCGDQFIRLAAEWCAWLEMRGIDPPQEANCEVYRSILSPTEYRLLEYLWDRKSASLDELEDRVWSKDLASPREAIEACVKRANAKLTDLPIAFRVKNGGVLLER